MGIKKNRIYNSATQGSNSFSHRFFSLVASHLLMSQIISLVINRMLSRVQPYLYIFIQPEKEPEVQISFLKSQIPQVAYPVQLPGGP